MAMTTVMAWSFSIRARNMAPTEAVSISTVDFSLILTHVMVIKRIKRTATPIDRYLKPFRSIISWVTPEADSPMAPRAGTTIMVKI